MQATSYTIKIIRETFGLLFYTEIHNREEKQEAPSNLFLQEKQKERSRNENEPLNESSLYDTNKPE